MAKTDKGGRPHLDGSPAGQGEYTKTYCITLPPETAERLREIGGGNLSKGVRMVAHHHQDTADEVLDEYEYRNGEQ